MSAAADNRIMLAMVARALGPDLVAQSAFLGGCTTALFLTDALTQQDVRYTKDVDLIISVINHGNWYAFMDELRARGFRERPDLPDDVPICALWLDGLRVDFMPDDPQILGFSNPWYPDALKTAQPFPLTEGVSIRLVRPEYFVATKLAAWVGRGHQDPEMSQDVEDLLAMLDGRSGIVDELAGADAALRAYCAQEFAALRRLRGFDRTVEGAARGNRGREERIHARIAAVVGLGA